MTDLHATAAEQTYEPAAVYAELRAAHRATQVELERGRGRVLLLLAGAAGVFLLSAFSFVRAGLAAVLPHVPAFAPLLVVFAAMVVLVMRSLRLQAGIETKARLLALYDTALGRVDGSEVQSGLTGQAAPAGHLFARDLDLFGTQSLFGLLATVRTTVGEAGLTRYLLERATHAETVLRQAAVRELAPRTRVREQIALLGSSQMQRISAGLIDEWLSAPAPLFPAWLRPMLVGSAVLACALLARPGLFGLHPWSAGVPWLAGVLAVQGAVCYRFREKISPLLATSVRLQQSIRLFGEGLALLEELSFTSTKLQALQAQAREPAGAVVELKRFESMLGVAEQRGQGYFLPLSLLLAGGAQTAISLARWKREHAAAMRGWLAAWSEFEALNALATYAFEHPQYAWPELLPETHAPAFVAEALGHPLLAGAVTNDVALGEGSQFYLISGSNMSGKSTLLRSVGINAVLAYAGAPVRARALRLTPLVLGASLALTDSLAEGTSKFKAEVARLAALVAAARQAPVLFLVDEIFSGTNSADRRTAAAAVLRTLLTHGGIGALSTHDLALTELATEANGGTNLHMASPDAEDPLAFDYRLKPGVNTSSNALAIVRMMGLEA